jgi:hypothetical protein
MHIKQIIFHFSSAKNGLFYEATDKGHFDNWNNPILDNNRPLYMYIICQMVELETFYSYFSYFLKFYTDLEGSNPNLSVS